MRWLLVVVGGGCWLFVVDVVVGVIVAVDVVVGVAAVVGHVSTKN